MGAAGQVLHPFERAWCARLTTYRQDGTAVPTLVNVAVQGDRAFMRTYASAGKVKRMRRNPLVELAPATWRGEVVGPAIRASARLLEGDEAEAAGRLIDARHAYFQRRLVRFGHRARGLRTVHFELTPLESAAGVTRRAA